MFPSLYPAESELQQINENRVGNSYKSVSKKYLILPTIGHGVEITSFVKYQKIIFLRPKLRSIPGYFRHKTCSNNAMLIVFGLFGLSAASVALLVHELRTAPEGYEDHNGFHIADKPATGSKTWMFRHRPAESASREEAAVMAEKRSARVRRELGSVTAAPRYSPCPRRVSR